MLPFAQLLTVRIGGVRIAGAALKGPAPRRRRPVSLSLNLSFQGDIRMARKTKEESQRTRDRILDAAEHVFMSKGWPTPPWATSPTTPACPGCRLRPLQEQDRCLRRHERPRAGRGRGADPGPRRRQGAGVPVRVDAAIRAHLLGRGVDAACWKSSTTSASRATRTRRCCDDGTSGNAMPCAIPKNCCAPRCATKTCPARWTCACPTSTCTP